MCGLLRLESPPTGQALDALYVTGHYDPAGTRVSGLAGLLHRVNNAFRLRELRGITPGRLLDVGSGKGHFLAAARARGWQVTGIEFAPAAVAESRHRYALEVCAGDFLTIPLEGGFDVVTMWHVLEHLPDPSAAVARARELLRPGGYLVVSVPNLTSIQARLAAGSWVHLDLPRHLFHFTPAALGALLRRHGFDVARTSYLYPEADVLGVLQSALNVLTPDHNLLYRYLKGDQSVVLGPGVLGAAGLALALAPAALTAAAIGPLVGDGASMQFLARGL